MAEEQKADGFEGFDKEVLVFVVEANRDFLVFKFSSVIRIIMLPAALGKPISITKSSLVYNIAIYWL